MFAEPVCGKEHESTRLSAQLTNASCMSVLIAMGVFVLSHVVIVRTGLRPALVDRWGERTYLLIYSAFSLVLMGWVIGSVMTADRTLLWATPVWSYWFAAITSAIGFALIGIGALVPNALSVSFVKAGFDPQRPGIVGWIRHPLIWGLTLWGVAHVPANGDWPSLVLFAGSAVFGLIGVVAIERRLKRRAGPERWSELTAGRGHVDQRSAIAAVLGLLLWVVSLMLHPTFFRVDPLAILWGP